MPLSNKAKMALCCAKRGRQIDGKGGQCSPRKGVVKCDKGLKLEQTRRVPCGETKLPTGDVEAITIEWQDSMITQIRAVLRSSRIPNLIGIKQFIGYNSVGIAFTYYAA